MLKVRYCYGCSLFFKENISLATICELHLVEMGRIAPEIAPAIQYLLINEITYFQLKHIFLAIYSITQDP